MALRFAVLGSGSSGNSVLIQAQASAGLLIDFGFGVRDLSRRLHAVGSHWGHVRSALLTHTHGDHVNIASLAKLYEQEIPLYCHEGHRRHLTRFGPYQRLESAGLVRFYDDEPFLTACGFRVEPIELSHDSGPCYGFRVEARGSRRSRPASVGYMADSGIWTSRVADALAEVDVLGIEFNHDIAMQKSSGRSASTIARNLGRYGHLSNEQGASLVTAVLERSGVRSPRKLVLLHISRQCNDPRLAIEQAKSAVRESGRRLVIHAAEQSVPSAVFAVEPRRTAQTPARIRLDRELAPRLPFWDLPVVETADSPIVQTAVPLLS